MSINSTTDPAGVISHSRVSGGFWNDYDDELDARLDRDADEGVWYAADGGLWPFPRDREPGEVEDD